MIQQINFVPGDTVRVHQKIQEIDKGKEKTRIQIFQGTVLGIRGRGVNKTFMVRKVVGDVEVERIYALFSPNIDKVELKEHSKKKVRRAKLYYLRKNR